MTNWLQIDGQVAVVTGGGGGIGRVISSELARNGAKVAVLDLDLEGAKATVEEIRRAGGSAHAVRVNITEEGSLTAALSEVETALGPVSILVNNAALLRNGPLKDLSLADWQAVISVNLTGFFLTSQVFGRSMMARGAGCIVHVASMAASNPQPTSGAYSVSKAGVLMLSRNLAQEWGPMGIRSNVVSPAMVMTPMSEVIYRDPEIKARREKAIPVRRIGASEDIANAVCYLASARASYVSGQEILCDGGWSTTLLQTVPRPGFDQPTS